MTQRSSDDTQPPSFAAPRNALFGGSRDAMGTPAIVLFASYVGFGSLVRESDLTIFHALFSTITGWALPGQIVLVELYGVGASILAISLAVALTNARLLPMTVVLMPLLRGPETPRWRYYLAAHVIAVTGWVQAMQRCPDLPPDQRLSYFVGYSGSIWIMTMIGTATGFLVSGMVPEPVSLGLVFLNTIYFLLIFTADLRQRARVFALAAGAVLGPLLHLATPDWGLLLTGLIGGSIAYYGDRLLGVRRASGGGDD